MKIIKILRQISNNQRINSFPNCQRFNFNKTNHIQFKGVKYSLKKLKILYNPYLEVMVKLNYTISKYNPNQFKTKKTNKRMKTIKNKITITQIKKLLFRILAQE